MIKPILNPATCKSCKICCNYTETSLWDIPGFTKEEYIEVIDKFPSMKAISYNKNNLYYFKPHKDNSIYLCPFLSENGCKLAALKPFKCKIWPLYVVKNGLELYIAKSNVCPNIPKISSQSFKEELYEQYIKIKEIITEHPELIEINRDFFELVIKL